MSEEILCRTLCLIFDEMKSLKISDLKKCGTLFNRKLALFEPSFLNDTRTLIDQGIYSFFSTLPNSQWQPYILLMSIMACIF